MNPSILILALAAASVTSILIAIFGRENQPWSTLVQGIAGTTFAGMIALDKIHQTYNEAASLMPPVVSDAAVWFICTAAMGCIGFTIMRPVQRPPERPRPFSDLPARMGDQWSPQASIRLAAGAAILVCITAIWAISEPRLDMPILKTVVPGMAVIAVLGATIAWALNRKAQQAGRPLEREEFRTVCTQLRRQTPAICNLGALISFGAATATTLILLGYQVTGTDTSSWTATSRAVLTIMILSGAACFSIRFALDNKWSDKTTTRERVVTVMQAGVVVLLIASMMATEIWQTPGKLTTMATMPIGTAVAGFSMLLSRRNPANETREQPAEER